ncbi:hypothetical protein [Pseudomonas sp. UMAB-40]|uniref:hypothetical protein n=1 Tax=Pseudomonas sp. UMAB-40 TaxID=1365407 RepID=UPI001C564278|nr:hypothetical protein [Pseudomonas sp. UMAB-40]
MVSNNLLRGAVTAALLALAGESSATGIPVYCYNCQEATNNAAHSNLDGLRLQTEALLNGMDYILRTNSGFNTAIASGAGVTQQRIQNAYKMDPTIAKPRLACSQAATAGVRSGSTGASNKLRQALVAKTSANNYRGANLPPGESRKEYSVQKVIDVLGEEDADPAEVLTSRAPIPNEASAIAEHRKIKDATVNPFPVELPPEEEIQRIKKKGSQGERENLARSYALMARQISAQSVLDEDESNRIQFVKSDPFKDQLSYMTEGMDDDTKKLWSSGQLSNYQVEKLGASYRAMSPTWIKQMSSAASPEAIQKEIMLEMAEMLHQQGIANDLQRQGNILSALKESREVSTTGLQTR